MLFKYDQGWSRFSEKVQYQVAAGILKTKPETETELDK